MPSNYFDKSMVDIFAWKITERIDSFFRYNTIATCLLQGNFYHVLKAHP